MDPISIVEQTRVRRTGCLPPSPSPPPPQSRDQYDENTEAHTVLPAPPDWYNTNMHPVPGEQVETQVAVEHWVFN